MKWLVLVALAGVAHADDSKVTLVKPGHGSLQKLRLALTNNEHHTLALELQRTSSRGPTIAELQPEKPSLAFALELDYEVTAIADDGSASVALHYRQSKTSVGGGTCSVSGNGAVRDLKITVVNGLTTDQTIAIEHGYWIASMAIVPFPIDAIGVGATWSTTEQVDTPMVTTIGTSSGLTTTATRTYELVSLAKSTATIRVSTMYTGSHPGSGTGEIVVDLASAFPTRATLSATTDDPIDPHVVVRRVTSTATLRRSDSR